MKILVHVCETRHINTTKFTQHLLYIKNVSLFQTFSTNPWHWQWRFRLCPDTQHPQFTASRQPTADFLFSPILFNNQDFVTSFHIFMVNKTKFSFIIIVQSYDQKFSLTTYHWHRHCIFLPYNNFTTLVLRMHFQFIIIEGNNYNCVNLNNFWKFIFTSFLQL